MGLLAVLAIVFLWVRRRRAAEEAAEAELAAAMELPEEISTTVQKELTEQEQERESQREKIEKLARTRPEDAAQLVKMWLGEEA